MQTQLHRQVKAIHSTATESCENVDPKKRFILLKELGSV